MVSKLLAGPKVFICGHCVGLCNEILCADGNAPFAELSDLSDEQILSTLQPREVAVASMYEVLSATVDELRKREVSWALIGKSLGVSRQAAWERFS